MTGFLACALEGVLRQVARTSSMVIQMAAGMATSLEVAVEVARATNQRVPRIKISSSTCPCLIQTGAGPRLTVLLS